MCKGQARFALHKLTQGIDTRRLNRTEPRLGKTNSNSHTQLLRIKLDPTQAKSTNPNRAINLVSDDLPRAVGQTLTRGTHWVLLKPTRGNR